MPRRKVSYKGARPRKIKYQRQEKLADDFLVYQIDRPGYSNEVQAFSDYFFLELARASVNLARVGVGVAKRALIGAETPWGQARMRGEYFGVTFRPYGKGPGRYDTGNMFNALKLIDTNAGAFVGAKKKNLFVEFGYDTKMDRGKSGRPYFLDQETGFLNPFSFDPDETRAAGEARFGRARKPRRVKGARALEAGMERIGQRADEYYSRAWENAKKRFESDGFAAAGVGTFVDAKNAFRPPRKFSPGRDSTSNMGISMDELTSRSEAESKFKL
jgi:hypothetical protein